jgi:hypothetical protein
MAFYCTTMLAMALELSRFDPAAEDGAWRAAVARTPILVPGQEELHQTRRQLLRHFGFHEYFHAETGAGLGASHQTGWTSLVADCLWKAIRGK